MAISPTLKFYIRKTKETGDFFVNSSAELGAGNIDRTNSLEMGDFFKLFHVGITNRSAREIQTVQLCHIPELTDRFAGKRVVRKIKSGDFREICQMNKMTILESRVPQGEILQSRAIGDTRDHIIG